MNAKEWKQYPKRKKKKKKRNLSLSSRGFIEPISVGRIGEQRTERDQSNVPAVSRWVCGGIVSGLHKRIGLWDLANISYPHLFVSEDFQSIYQSSRRHDFCPLFFPILTYLFLPLSLWMMGKSMPSPCSCPCVKHFFPSCLREQTSPECEHGGQVFPVWNVCLCVAGNGESVFICFVIVPP